MATDAQRELFDRLVGQKNIGDNNPDELKKKFAELSDKNASAWIEALLAKDDAGTQPPPF